MEVFVVRVWPEPDELRGRVEHVGSGSTHAFRDSQTLLSFLGSHLGSVPADGALVHGTLIPPEPVTGD